MTTDEELENIDSHEAQRRQNLIRRLQFIFALPPEIQQLHSTNEVRPTIFDILANGIELSAAKIHKTQIFEFVDKTLAYVGKAQA